MECDVGTSRSLVRIRKYGKFVFDSIAIRLDPEAWLRRVGARVGEGCRFYGVKPGTFGSEPFLISIGDHVTITDGVKLITHDGGLWIFRKATPKIELFAPIEIGSRVFIGVNAIILPGSVISDDSIVAAGAVVRGSFPPRSVIGGVPAKVLGTVDDYFAKNESSITTEFFGLTGGARREALTRKYLGRQA
ncbi:acyltransferase [Arenimonas composti]|uniref:acyltransferase n=1 Tax=Arenimonas composti TaxID=370776 RepID=UPI0013784833|nr:acyltransferase [Arenimonas composti]